MAVAEAAVSEAASTSAASASSAAAEDDAPPACDDSACSTPFVSAPSSPSRDRDRDRDAYPPHFFFSAPTSPARKGDAAAANISGGVLDFDFDFSSRFPSPSAAAMSSADELFHNGQIRPVRLAAALLQPHPADPDVMLDFPPGAAASDTPRAAGEQDAAEADERGRVRGRSVRRKARSMSPFRSHWRSASHAPEPPVPEPECAGEARQTTATPAASRSSSSSSTASTASSASSSSSSRGGSRRWGGFLKDLLHRSKSDGGKTTQRGQHSHPNFSAASAAAPKPSASSSTSPSPSPSPAAAAAKGGRGGGTPGHHRGSGGRRKMSAHERLYEARRAEAEEMRRRTSLPYRQGLLLFGCIGLGSRSSAVHGLARGLNAAAAVSSRS